MTATWDPVSLEQHIASLRVNHFDPEEVEMSTDESQKADLGHLYSPPCLLFPPLRVPVFGMILFGSLYGAPWAESGHG